ncbi:MAG: nuclear transport factor 2 family protein [Halioglobus sp.]
MNPLADELALRNLMARYVDAVHRRDAQSWIATWVDDGMWNLLGNPVHGRDNILGLWQQMMDGFEFALMLPSSCLFEVEGDSASGHWYLHEYTRDLQGNTSTIISRYQDTYAKRDGQWLFQSRHYNFLYNGPADLSGTYTPPPVS